MKFKREGNTVCSRRHKGHTKLIRRLGHRLGVSNNRNSVDVTVEGDLLSEIQGKHRLQVRIFRQKKKKF